MCFMPPTTATSGEASFPAVLGPTDYIQAEEAGEHRRGPLAPGETKEGEKNKA